MKNYNLKNFRLGFLLFLILSANCIYSHISDEDLNLAFNMREFVTGETPSLSPDGKRIAYSVKQAADKRIFITTIDALETQEINCPGGCCSRPVWSPKDNLLAFYSNANGVTQLWVYDVAEDKSRKLCDFPVNSIDFPSDESHWGAFDEPCWSPDGRTVYIPLQPLKKDKAFEDDPVKVTVLYNKPVNQNNQQGSSYNSTLAAIPIDTGSVRAIVPADATPQPSFMKLSPSGKWLSYLSIPVFIHNPRYTSYDLAVAGTGGNHDPITIVKGLESSDPFHRFYLWHPAKDILVYLKDQKLFVVEFTEDGPGPVRQLCLACRLNFIPKPLLFSRDGCSIVVGANPYWEDNKTNPENLFVIPLEPGAGAPIKLSFGEDWKYISALESDRSHLWQPEKDTVCLFLEKDDTAETAVVSFNLKNKKKRTLWKGMARMENFISGKNPEEIYCLYQDLRSPPNIYRLKADGSRPERISHIDSRLDQLKIPSHMIFETYIPFYKGELKKVKTSVLLPQGRNPEDIHPGIVLIYPGSNASNFSRKFLGGDMISVPNFIFLNRGYALIFPDIVLRPEGEAGEPLQEIVDAILPQIYHAANLGYADIHRLGIAGQSFGGYGVGAVISKSNLFRAAVAIAGVYDLVGNYGSFDEFDTFSNVHWMEHGQGRMGTHPWDHSTRYLINSPYYYADKIHTPLFLLHGGSDEYSNVQESKKMFTALNRLDRKVQLAVYEDEGHRIYEWEPKAAIDASTRMLDFFEAYLKQ